VDISCLSPCTENEASPLDPWVPPTPSESGLVFADSASIIFTGVGTEADPIVATVQGNIEVEIATSRLAGFTDNELIFAYATAKGFTLRAGLPGATVAARNADDLQVNLYQNETLIGNITVTAGVPAFSFVADVVFEPDDLLEFRGVLAPSFDLLAITLVGERELTFV
jgi:hypothetical protein